MAVWTVFEPEQAASARSTRQWADGFVFVAERFTWGALLFAPLVLLLHRLWLALLSYLIVQSALFTAIFLLDLDSDALALLIIPNVIVAVELAGLRRAKLIARGFEEVGAVVAPTLEAAEQRYFDAHLTVSPAFASPRAERVTAPVRPPEAGILGLFPEARR